MINADAGGRQQPRDHPARVGLVAVGGAPVEIIVQRIIAGQGWQMEHLEPADLVRAATQSWDLIVIVAESDAVDVIRLCAAVGRNPAQRVIVIASERAPQRIADALYAGADDYMTTPLDEAECRARMEALIRRAGGCYDRRTNVLWTEERSRTVGIGSAQATLSPREWAVLLALLEAQPECVRGEWLERQLWGDTGHYSTLAATVSRLRHKLRSHQLHGITIEAVRRRGYVLKLYPDCADPWSPPGG